MGHLQFPALIAFVAAVAIAAISTSFASSEAARSSCNEWSDDVVLAELAALPAEPQDDPEQYRTGLWETMALCGYLWDANPEEDLRMLEWRLTPRGLDDHLDSLAMKWYLSREGRHPTYPKHGLNYGARIEVHLVSWGIDGHYALFSPEHVYGAYRIRINRDHWAKGGFPNSDLLHELAHLQDYVSNKYSTEHPPHNAEFRRTLMDAHLHLNPHFDFLQIDHACRIANLVGIEVSGCDGEPWELVSYSFDPLPQAEPSPTPPSWTPLEVTELTVTGNWTGMSELHTGWWVWQMHQADGLDAYVACRPDTGELHQRHHGGDWTQTTVQGVRAHFGFADRHFIDSAMADIAHACKVEVESGEPEETEDPAPIEITEPSSITIDAVTGETIWTYIFGTLTCVIRSGGSANCTDSSNVKVAP